MMFRPILAGCGILFVATASLFSAGQGAAAQGAASAAPSASPQRALLNRYCVTCHNERLKTADLMLDRADVENVSAAAPLWEKVVRKLRTASMPPAGAPRPDPASYDSLASYLETELDRAAAADPNPGRPAVHRLNRVEYANAIRDLLAVKIDGAALLPVDDAGHGFDNIADMLSVSPLLVERYMFAARRITRLALGDPAARPFTENYDVSRYLVQDDRMSEDLPLGSRGGIAVRHPFPLDGEYVLTVRLQRNKDNYIIGLAEPHLLDVRVDGARIKLLPVGGEHKGASGPLYSFILPDYRGDPDQEQYELTADAALEVRFPAKAGERLVQVAFLNETFEHEGQGMPRQLRDELTASGYKGGPPAVDRVSISGPYNAKGLGETSSRAKILVCTPAGAGDEEACARKILSTLVRQAYRRPVTEVDLQVLLGFYHAGRKDGGFEAGIGAALQRMLVSPEFLFRIERDPPEGAPGKPYRISNLELASRLSFFLWSSIPDDELLTLAERGKLHDPEVLQQQVQRMVGDARSRELVNNFAGQWLSLRNLRNISPDPKVFPDFDDNLREALREESELFFESMLREDRSVLDLLAADYTFLNERLARHYGIADVFGSHFRRVELRNEDRKGLLGQGSVLTATSYSNRTAPTIRGKWLLENIFGAPPPPPPPNVPSLQEEEGSGGKVLTMRERLEHHRANPVCAACHNRMDPLGFALENFDALGKWRTVEGDTPIDSSGQLPDGTRFQGPAELREILLARREQFVITVTEKLLTYALGRGLEHYDQPVVRKIVRDSASNGYRWSSLIVGIVNSTPFQMRRSP
jgi:mono/diheme cytochrome c family protein